jgi:S1-C subfamily serine protease
MAHRFAISAMTAFAALCGACSSARETGTTTIQVVAPAPPVGDPTASAVDIRAIGCKAEAVRGAGAMINGNYILTAAHVVSGSLSISVVPATSTTGEPTAARVVALDPAADLALLIAPGLDIPGLPVGQLETGDVGSTLIFRDGKVVQQPFTIVRPVIVKILDIYQRDKVDRKGYQVDVEIVAGDSGAVLVDADGHAGATIYAKSRGATNRAWAVGPEAIPALVASAKAGPVPEAPVGECAR